MNIFSSIAGNRPRYNKFNLSHEKKLTLDMGNLVPTYLQEIVPGDRFKVNSEIFLRFAPLIAPMMHRVNVFMHFFFVPNRLLWDEWEDFITGGKDGDLAPEWPWLDMTSSTKPYLQPGELGDYLGLPTMTEDTFTANTPFSALPFRAYQQIYNDYYRDANLEDEIAFLKTGGWVSSGNKEEHMRLRVRSWEKDYFTSALPWAQRGGAASVPGSPNYSQYNTVVDDAGNPAPNVEIGQSNASSQLQTDLSNYIAIHNIDDIDIDINDLRTSVKLQEWLERSARGGSRYIEQILSHFGVRSSDKRLQRAEYLGGGRQPVSVSEVLNTTGIVEPDAPEPNDPTGGAVQGNMAGHGISVGSKNRFNKRFEEHGWVMGIMSVMPKTAYQEGVPRHWSRETKFDYFWPEFAHLGEQEIKNKEIFAKTNQTSDFQESTWGYQSIFADYKYNPSTVHGNFKDSLAYWHLGRIFEDKSFPNLDEYFMIADISKRVFAVEDPDQHNLYAQVYNKVDAKRPMPYFGTPKI